MVQASNANTHHGFLFKNNTLLFYDAQPTTLVDSSVVLFLFFLSYLNFIFINYIIWSVRDALLYLPTLYINFSPVINVFGFVYVIFRRMRRDILHSSLYNVLPILGKIIFFQNTCFQFNKVSINNFFCRSNLFLDENTKNIRYFPNLIIMSYPGNYCKNL